MSDTPETDAAAEEVGMGHFMVDADFARKLERERDEAREQIKGLELKWKFAVEMAALAQLKLDNVKEAAK